MTVPSELPETQYATVGDLSIAYQVMGKGPMDFIVVPGRAIQCAQVLMSKLVTDLVAGSSKFSFESLGPHELKGLSGEFDIFRGLIN